MAQIICKGCKKEFDTNDKRHNIFSGVSTLTSAAGGGFVGSSIGIAALGTAISGTLPLAVIFGVGGYALSKIVFKCPHCGKIFRS